LAKATERGVLSKKEAAKEKRRAVYLYAKEWRATNPRYLEMKEAVREQRRAAYLKALEQRKAVVAEEKARQQAARAILGTLRRATQNRGLFALISCVSQGSIAAND
jgi:thymidylate synthase ThyX